MSSRQRILWLTLYSVAMGVLEAAVVVYLRELYYPGGFRFPLVPLPTRVALIEVIREATTIAMLLAVAALAGKDKLDRFFVFGFLFGMWDLVYYAGLFAFLRWPSSLLTWDILFLIPIPWVSPVLCPVLVSAALVGGFLLHEALRSSGRMLRPSAREWSMAAAGAAVIVSSLCWRSRAALDGVGPARFPWGIFALGLAVAIAPLLRAARR